MADDSEVKEETPAAPVEEKPTGPISMIVRAPNGGVREMLKDPETGKIVAKPKRMVTTLEITRLGRKFLDLQVPAGKDIKGKYKKRIEKMFDAMYEIATSEEAKNDPKFAMAAVQAFKELSLRVYGKPTISDEEKDALQRAGVRIVVIPAPALMNPQVHEEKREEKSKSPSFLLAEHVYTNEPEKTGG